MSERTAVYRLFSSDGRLLYIGMSKDPEFRWKAHELVQPWWPEVADRWCEWYDSRDEASDAEREAILAEDPVYNRQRVPVTRAEPPRVYCCMPYDLAEELEEAAKPYVKAMWARDRGKMREAEASLAPLIYEGLSLGCQPHQMALSMHITKEQSAAICGRYTRSRPDLPPVPTRAVLRERMLERVRAA